MRDANRVRTFEAGKHDTQHDYDKARDEQVTSNAAYLIAPTQTTREQFCKIRSHQDKNSLPSIGELGSKTPKKDKASPRQHFEYSTTHNTTTHIKKQQEQETL